MKHLLSFLLLVVLISCNVKPDVAPDGDYQSRNYYRVYSHFSSDRVTVDIISHNQQVIQIKGFDPKGKQFFYKQLTGQREGNQVFILLPNAGVYYLEIIIGNQTYRERIIRQ